MAVQFMTETTETFAALGARVQDAVASQPGAVVPLLMLSAGGALIAGAILAVRRRRRVEHWRQVRFRRYFQP